MSKTMEYPDSKEVIKRAIALQAKKADKEKKLILDGYMIMKKYTDCKAPAEVTAIKIRKANLNDVFEEDMKYFSNLSSVDVQDNEIPVWKF